MNRVLGIAIMAALLALAAAPRAEPAIQTPGQGSPERKAILDEVRVPVEVMLGAPVEFVVRRMNVGDGWAFVVLEPQRPGGGKIDVSKTRIADWGFLDGLTTFALLKFQSGRWHLIDKVIGPTDVAWDGWDEAYGAPRRIFPYR